jgi:vacuolar protein sorting-associated protein 1
MEVVLSHAEDDTVQWSCQITLLLSHDVNNVQFDRIEKIPFGGPLNDSKLVEDRLRRAQAAILQLPFSCDQSIAPFLADDYEAPTKPPTDFSRNVVRLEVNGPDLVDVTFIDLPGIIQNANMVLHPPHQSLLIVGFS